VEVILFSKDLQQYQSELAPETLVFFKGQVDRRRREPSLRVSEVIPLEQADERLSAMVIIRLDGTGPFTSVLEALAELITQHSGDRPVFLEVWTGGHMKVTIRARAGLRVRPTPAFRQAVDELLGPGHLEILPPVRLGRPTPPKPAQRPLPYQEQPKLPDRQRGSSTTAPAC
jgi:DNA polymerase III alpha subunit